MATGSETPIACSDAVTFRTSREYGSRSSTIAADLGEHIVAGRITPGTALRVDALASEYDVSPTPVREALHTLVAEGLVRKERSGGYLVAELSREDILDVFLVAAYVAGELAARAVEELSAEDLSELWAIHYETLALVHRSDLASLDTKSRAFHSIVNHAAPAPKLRWMARMTSRFIPRSLFPEIPGWPELTVKAQEGILSALEKRDSAAARKAAEVTLRRAGEMLADELAARSAVPVSQPDSPAD